MRARELRLVLGALLTSWAFTALAQDQALGSRSPLVIKTASSTILPVDQAFKLVALLDSGGNARLSWNIQPGYYLYQQKIEVSSGDGHQLPLKLPPGKILTDDFQGESPVYFDSLQLTLSLQDLASSPTGDYRFKVSYLGCAQDRYCYPPVTREITLVRPK